jgi:hypothetical protein
MCNIGDLVKMNDLIGIITKIEHGRIIDGVTISPHIKHYTVFWLKEQQTWTYCEDDVNKLFVKETT